MIKELLFSTLIVVALLFMTSCFDDYDVEDWNLANAQISTFSLYNDSIADLANVKFTIDQLNGKIFNADSMPYGTDLRFKVLCSLSFEIGAYSVLIMPQATNDSIWWSETDSVDFSQPVILEVYPYDGITKKTYEAKLNIHQVNPDSIIWEKQSAVLDNKSFDEVQALQFNDAIYIYLTNNNEIHLYITDTLEQVGRIELPLTSMPKDAVLSQLTLFEGKLYVPDAKGILYFSQDGQSWTPLEGAPVLKALIGAATAGSAVNSSAFLSALTSDNEGTLYYAAMDSENNWQTGNKANTDFPVKNFGRTSYELVYYSRLVIVGGRTAANNVSDVAWSTTDGLNWAALSNDSKFRKIEGASLIHYNDSLYMFGGHNQLGIAFNEIYCSPDNGVSWYLTEHTFPDSYKARGFSSVYVNYDNYILVFGGKSDHNEATLNEIWRGRMNRLGFKKDD